MFIRLLCWLLLVICPASAHADELTPQKKDDIRKLIVTTGGTRVGVQFAAAITQNLSKTLKAAHPEIPDGVYTIVNDDLVTFIEEKINAPGGMLDRIVPVYDKHFTHREITELLAFYQSPAGRKALEVLPKVFGESVMASQAWGKSLEPEIRKRVDEVLDREGVEMPAR